MFNSNFFPTPYSVIEQMLEGETIKDKIILEPSAGKGDIVDFCIGGGALSVIACENNNDLRKIVGTKCQLIGSDFLQLESHGISHIHMIIMNPPFNADEKHIVHAYNIAPPGCKIISLCNSATLENAYSKTRKELLSIIESYGQVENLGDCFSDAERKTGINVSLVKIQKAGANYNTEFEGFFTDEEPEELGENGLMSYNVVRDLVNRYVGSVKIFDEQLTAAVKMNALTSGFYRSDIGMNISEGDKPMKRAEFKKAMQKSGWKFIFEKMNMQKYATKGLREDLNKFVEQQTNIPFTMKNIYKMLEIVIGTQSSRMDKALLEVFDKLTTHYSDNRFNVEGWKTNSHYLINQNFILPYLASINYSGGMGVNHYQSHYEVIDDMQKALCYVTGKNYDDIGSIWSFFQNKEVPGTENLYPKQYVKYSFNTWYEWGFFELKGYKKGTMHFKFLDLDVWAKFNQHISRLKGYPLFEYKEQTKWQKNKNKSAA